MVFRPFKLGRLSGTTAHLHYKQEEIYKVLEMNVIASATTEQATLIVFNSNNEVQRFWAHRQTIIAVSVRGSYRFQKLMNVFILLAMIEYFKS